MDSGWTGLGPELTFWIRLGPPETGHALGGHGSNPYVFCQKAECDHSLPADTWPVPGHLGDTLTGGPGRVQVCLGPFCEGCVAKAMTAASLNWGSEAIFAPPPPENLLKSA